MIDTSATVAELSNQSYLEFSNIKRKKKTKKIYRNNAFASAIDDPEYEAQ
jgi:hypothetical protein